MKTMTRAHLFGGPERVRKAKKRIERAQLLTASVRELAMDLARKYEGSPRNEAQRRRLAKLQLYRRASRHRHYVSSSRLFPAPLVGAGLTGLSWRAVVFSAGGDGDA